MPRASTTPRESTITKRILQHLKTKGWFFKVHGSPYQEAGVPDIVGCYKGLTVCFEVKVPGEVTSKVQDMQIKLIRNNGGWAAVVTSLEEVKQVLAQVDGPL